MFGARSIQSLCLAIGVVVGGAGCRSCATTGASDEVGSGVVKKSKRSYRPSPKLQNLAATPHVVVLRAGSKVWLWVDGRSSALSLGVDSVRWAPSGFEYVSASGFTKVLAPGGSLHYRLGTAGTPDSQPLETVFGRPSGPPAGFGIDYVDGAGGSRVQAILTGPEGRRVRLGLFERVPDEQVWLQGELRASGEPSPELSVSAGFAKRSDGRLAHELPKDAEALSWSPVPAAKLSEWVGALQAFSKDGSPLTIGSASSADLDRDGVEESILCLEGAVRMLDPRCVLLDEVEGETRIYGLSLPWTPGGPEPLAFTLRGAPYAMMASEDGRRGAVVRSFGTGWVVDAIR